VWDSRGLATGFRMAEVLVVVTQLIMNWLTCVLFDEIICVLISAVFDLLLYLTNFDVFSMSDF
jgi:hypothetical protein